MFDYYLPGFNYAGATMQEYARKWKHLEFIREQEARASLELAKIGMAVPGKRNRRRR